MDKYEYQVHADEIKKLIGEHRYAEAMDIADNIDWRKVRSVSMLQTVSEIYKINKKYEEAREILLLAYDRYPNRNIVYALCELAIKLNDVVQAKLLYEEFVSLAPNDTSRYVLLYKLYEALDVSVEERIELLEEFKQKDYTERWAYELALLYHKIGQETKCVEACDELIIWFGEGKYVKKAMELKMKHTRLSKEQQLKYEGRQEPIPVTDKFMNVNPEPAQQLYDTDPQSGKLQQIPMTPYSQDYQQAQTFGAPAGSGAPFMQGQQGYDRIRAGMNITQQGMNAFEQGQSVDVNTPVPGQLPEMNAYEQGQPADMNIPVTGQQLSDMDTPVPGQDHTSDSVNGMWTEDDAGTDKSPALKTSLQPVRTDLQHTAQMLTTSEIDKIEIKPLNMGMYNTIDLQNGLSENIKKFFESEQNLKTDSDEQYDTDPSYAEPGNYTDTDGYNGSYEENAIELSDSNGPVISLKSFNPADNELDEVPGSEEDMQITTFMPAYRTEGTDGDETESEDTETEGVADEADPELKSIYEDWENKKRENEERRIQEAKVLSLQQTADIMAQLKGVLPEIDDIAKPTPPRGIAAAPPYFAMPEEPEYEEEGEEEPVQEESAAAAKDEYDQEDTQEYGQEYEGGYEIDFAKKSDSEKEAAEATEEKAESGDEEPSAAESAVQEPEDNEYPEAGETDAEPSEDEEYPEAGENDTEPTTDEEYPETEELSETEKQGEYSDDDTEPVKTVEAEAETSTDEEYPETEDLPEIETSDDEYPEEEPDVGDHDDFVKDESEDKEESDDNEASDGTWKEELPAQEIFYEPEMADDSWAEQEAKGKTEEMPIREVTYEPEAEPLSTDTNELYFREIMNIEDSDDEPESEKAVADDAGNKEDLSYSEDEEASRRAAFEVTSELPQYPYEELDDYGEVEEMVMIEQPDGLDSMMKTDDLPLDAIARANYEAGMEFDYDGIDEQRRISRAKTANSTKHRRPGYMKLETTAGSKREFDEEERLVFGRFQNIEWLKSQIVDAMDAAGMESASGNVIVMGNEPSGRKAIAVDIVKVMRATEIKFKGKVAKISGEALNKKDIPLTIKKLRQGALIVENAQDLTPSSARLVAEALELESEPVLVILEGDKKGLTEILDSSKDIMTRVFNSRIDLQDYTTDDLVAYGKSYAGELEYVIDDMGILALYRKIGDLQTLDHMVTLEEVCEIIDNAIKHVDKKNMSHFMDVLLAKRYDDNDFIILREKDFIQ